VIAETNDLQTKFRKIVVTDDRGRYVIPDLPKASYQVWVRGYGLVDSPHVQAVPGATLALTAVAAPTPRAAAQYYPANYWYSLMQVPPIDAFPMRVEGASGSVIPTQAEWVAQLRCTGCHQVGTLATRQLPKNLGTFESSAKAWERALRAGQVGADMARTAERFGHERGPAMFADWSDRIAGGELPQAPPRPQGVERNVVITLWDFSVPVAFVHDVVASDQRRPTVNAYGKIYGTEWSQDAIVTVDPVKHTKGLVKIPVKDESERAVMPKWSPQSMTVPSPVWGEELVWNDVVNPESAMMDGEGRTWFTAATHKAESQAAYCKAGTANPFGSNFPITIPNTHGVGVYDPRTGSMRVFNLCFASYHLTIANDKDDTVYFNLSGTGGIGAIMVGAIGGIGWVKPKILLETGDEEKAQGWCPPVIDYNGDGKTGAYTSPPAPPDPARDRLMPGSGYALATHPSDGSVWYTSYSGAIPGMIVRMHPGANPPSTCTTEVYAPPFNNPKVPGVRVSQPRGIDVDRQGIVWTVLNSNHLASFDRRKCTVLRGPTATGQHCPEGWTMYRIPGPGFKGVADDLGADDFYFNRVDQFDTFGLGKNASFVAGGMSDSLMALDPATKKWTVLRVPYPLGFYPRWIDGRIDDPKAGWKGRGLWSSNNARVVWLGEGGKGATSYVAHFQLRPNPLAK
jgi:hypothetical protein